MKILIAEDEIDLAEALQVFFEKNQFTADVVHDGEDAYDYALNGNYDAVILDVMMPRRDGIEALKMLRASGVNVPVMMLTAKTQKDDRITGFDAGADDYLPQPFAPDELLCRVRAMLRRSGDYKPTVMKYSDLTLDPSNSVLSSVNGNVRLSATEYKVIELFMRSPNVVFSADTIMERVWGWDSDAEINVVWVHISNLRKKLKSVGSSVTIKASRGLGYIMEAGDGQ